MTNLRSFNEAGLHEFRSYLTQLKADSRLEPPRHVLQDVRCSQLVEGGTKVDQRAFDLKLDFGRYFCGVVTGKVPEAILRTSAGLWAWLAFFYLDQVCPPDSGGRRRVLRLEKYIPSSGHIATGLDKHLPVFPVEDGTTSRRRRRLALRRPNTRRLESSARVSKQLSTEREPAFIKLASGRMYSTKTRAV